MKVDGKYAFYIRVIGYIDVKRGAFNSAKNNV